MKCKNINICEFPKYEILNQDKSFCYKFDSHQIDYQQKYFNTKFLNLSFILSDKKIIVPVTKDINMQTKLSFFGEPLQIFFSEELTFDDYAFIKEKISSLKGEYEFKIKIKNQDIKPEELYNNNNSIKIINEIYINLEESISEIQKKFSSNLRNEINKEYENTKYEIIDYSNYLKDQILEMMNLHIKISGRQTRSLDSWRQNEKMILEKKGFLTRVTYNNHLASYSFFCHDHKTCIYLSSVANRELYSKIRNIHHRSIWLAINYTKKICKNFFIGSITILSKKSLTEKEKNIEKFKSKFKGLNEKYIIMSKIPEYNFFQHCLKK